MKLNRELQRRFLVEMTECFPNHISNEFLSAIAAEYDEDEIDGNLMYLQMHGLITLDVSHYLGGGRSVRIKYPTQKAFDFLAEDGGFSAILNVQIANTLVSLLYVGALLVGLLLGIQSVMAGRLTVGALITI